MEYMIVNGKMVEAHERHAIKALAMLASKYRGKNAKEFVGLLVIDLFPWLVVYVLLRLFL